MYPNDQQPEPVPPAPQTPPVTAPSPQPAQPQYTPTQNQDSASVAEPSTPHHGQGQYDFILNPAPTPKKTLFSGEKSPLKLLAIVGGGAVLFIVVAMVLTSMLAKGSAPLLTTIAQQQQELQRIAAQAEDQSTSESVRGFAYNVDMSIGTDNAQLLSYLAKQGTKLSTKQLALKHDPATDQLLANAEATSTYDSTLQKVLATQLTTYLNDLKKAYSQTNSKTLRSILNSSFDSGKTLLLQAQADGNQTQ